MYTQLPLNLPNPVRIKTDWATFVARLPRGERPELEIVSQFRDEPETEPRYVRDCPICGCHMTGTSPAVRFGNDLICGACDLLTAAIPTPVVQDGTYTIDYVNGDPHFTFRVKTLTTGKLSGKTIVEYLTGPDNTSDYRGFAFIDPQTADVRVWGRFQSEKMQRRGHHVSAIFKNGNGESAGMRYAMRSGRCRRCNRELTVPASIHRGYGPDCAAKMGI